MGTKLTAHHASPSVSCTKTYKDKGAIQLVQIQGRYVRVAGTFTKSWPTSPSTFVPDVNRPGTNRNACSYIVSNLHYGKENTLLQLFTSSEQQRSSFELLEHMCRNIPSEAGLWSPYFAASRVKATGASFTNASA